MKIKGENIRRRGGECPGGILSSRPGRFYACEIVLRIKEGKRRGLMRKDKEMYIYIEVEEGDGVYLVWVAVI